MIDFYSETIVPFSQTPKHVPGRPHISTCHRFRTRGSYGIYLETFKVGGRRYTSIEAIGRFIERTTAAADGKPIPGESSKQREVAIAAAERELDAAGI